jgi:hypothetical protein
MAFMYKGAPGQQQHVKPGVEIQAFELHKRYTELGWQILDSSYSAARRIMTFSFEGKELVHITDEDQNSFTMFTWPGWYLVGAPHATK